MNNLVSSGTKRGNGKIMKQPYRNATLPPRGSGLRGLHSDGPDASLTVSAKEKTYFEYVVETEPMVQDFLGLLIDGDAFPVEYDGGVDTAQESATQIHWGRVVRTIAQTTHFEGTGKDLVEGSVVTQLEGALKISAPYHLSRRKRHAVLFKPFKERCVRKVYFQRVSTSSDPAKAWELSAVSAVKGGTDDTEVQIDALTMKVGEESQHQIQSPLNHEIRMGVRSANVPQHHRGSVIDFELKVRSSEMEQNIIVLRSPSETEAILRKQLQFQSDTRQETEYCQNYRGTIARAQGAAPRTIVAEAILRSSLYDTGAPVSTCFWVFPV